MTHAELQPIKNEMLRLTIVTLDKAINGEASAENALKSIQVFDAVHAMVCRELAFCGFEHSAYMHICDANGQLQTMLEDGVEYADEIVEVLATLQEASRCLDGGRHGP